MTDNAAPTPATAKRRRPKWLFGALGGLIGFALVYGWGAYKNRERSFLAQPPPEFPAEGQWLNVQAPLSLANLRGKVVLVQFSFVRCHFCRLMDPYLLKWHQQFAADGLTVIEVDDGNVDTADEVQQWVKKDAIAYPVFYDTDGRMTQRYGVQSYPKRILIGRNGAVVREDGGWRGEEGVTQIEDAIRKALAG